MIYLGIGLLIYLVSMFDNTQYEVGSIMWVWKTLEWLNIVLWIIAPFYWITYKFLEHFSK